jgi:hypothetical protein
MDARPVRFETLIKKTLIFRLRVSRKLLTKRARDAPLTTETLARGVRTPCLSISWYAIDVASDACVNRARIHLEARHEARRD